MADKTEDMILPIAGALALSAVAGSYLTGASLVDVATSFDGALGAATGVALGPSVVKALKIDGKNTMLVTAGMAVAVPALVAMKADSVTLVVAAGAVAGAYAVTQYLTKKTSPSK